MEIRIDTKRDSVDDIKKAIKFLKEFVESDGSSEVPAGAFNMFSNSSDDDSTNSDDKKDDDVEIKPIIEPY